MLYQNKICGFLPQVPLILPILLIISSSSPSSLVLQNSPPFEPSKSHHYDPKQQEFKIQTNKVP